MDVLLSIKPKYVMQIRTRRKRFEFRKRVFSNKGVQRVYIYETSPVKKVVGFFDVEDIIEDTPENIWAMSREYAGIEYDDYIDYFGGIDIGFAIKIGSPQFFDEPRELSDFLPSGVPPQSFCYLGGQ